MITTAKGTILDLSDVASPASYASVSQVRSITGPTVKPKIVDVTAHSDPGFWSQMLAVLIAAGDISFELNYNSTDATQAFETGFWNQMIGLTLSGFQLIFPNSAGTLVCTGYVGGHEFSAPVDNVLSVKMTLALTNDIVATNP
jgi:Lambda phage tail tube protein, TTP